MTTKSLRCLLLASPALLLLGSALLDNRTRRPGKARPLPRFTVAHSPAAMDPSSPVTSTEIREEPESAPPGRAVTALMRLEAPELREIVRSAADSLEVQAAIWSMANRLALSDEDVDALLGRLEESQDPRVLKTLLWALSLRQDRLPIGRIAALGTNHSSEIVRRAALRTLGTVIDPRSREFVMRRAVQDSDAATRREAVFFLTLHLDANESMAAAQHGLREESAPPVRAQWVSLIGGISSPDVPAILQSLLRSEREELSVRKTAAEMLVQGDPQVAAAMATDGSLPIEIREDLQAMIRETREVLNRPIENMENRHD